MTNYFEHPYCSNSALSKLKRDTEGSFLNGNPYEAYRFGSLFDAVVTEPEILDLIQKKIIGTEYMFTSEEYIKCKSMYSSLAKNELYAMMMKLKVEFQKELYLQNIPFHYEGVDFALNMKAKLDFFVPPRMVADLKSTAATTQKAFEAACLEFDYYRQMVLYCKLTGANMAIIFGVSKVNHKTFQVQLKKGDDKWASAENQLNELAFKYYLSSQID